MPGMTFNPYDNGIGQFENRPRVSTRSSRRQEPLIQIGGSGTESATAIVP